jgi:hypothetical protein
VSTNPNDEIGKQVTGIVTGYFPSEHEHDPYTVYIDGVRYSSFAPGTVEAVVEGIKVTFRAEKNGDYWNIKDGTVAVIDHDPDGWNDRGMSGGVATSECAG